MENEITKEVQEFIDALTALSAQLGNIFRSGDISILGEMNTTIKRMYRVQHGSTQSALSNIEEECKVIYGNFDMMIAVLRTTEEDEIDRGAQKAIGKFLHNINEATVNIAAMFGLI